MDHAAPLRIETEGDPPVGNIKATREDWLAHALARLKSDGVDGVKIQPIGADLGVSRSSFYWYFKSRQDLLDALLQHWQATNTASLVEMAERPTATITAAVGNVFRCVINPALFDTQLDFAVRGWARRSKKVHTVLRASEAQRLAALQAMFERFDYPPLEAVARARILYFMQIGYDDAELNEPMADRNALVPAYIVGFTGQHPTKAEVETLRAYAIGLQDMQND